MWLSFLHAHSCLLSKAMGPEVQLIAWGCWPTPGAELLGMGSGCWLVHLGRWVTQVLPPQLHTEVPSALPGSWTPLSWLGARLPHVTASGLFLYQAQSRKALGT